MKKIVLTSLLIICVAFLFCACTGSQSNQKETTSTSTTENVKPAEAEIPDLVKSETPLEKAKISSAEACEKISSLSTETLGLSGKKDDYKFMVSTQGIEIDGSNYFEVVASVVKQENDDGTINVVTKGQYFVSYDGSKLLTRDPATGDFSELK